MADASRAADDLVKTIKKPFQAVSDVFDKISSKKPEYTDMHKNMVDKANESFRKQADEKKPAKKKVGAGEKSYAPAQIKAAPKKPTQKKVASTKR
jgi:hypothetical protein